VPSVRLYSPPPRTLDASTIGWFNGSPAPLGRPATTAIVAGESGRRGAGCWSGTGASCHPGLRAHRARFL
jgi:hypothetical protein